TPASSSTETSLSLALEGRSAPRDVGRTSEYDWDKLGSKVNGTPKVSPDDLASKAGVMWMSSDYSVRTKNCHHFVMFLLDKVGASFFYKSDYNSCLMSLF
ncbi:hypothetical protein KIPB_006832, partial [Kipferlia bialata]